MYLAVRAGRRDELIEVNSAERQSPHEQTIVTDEVDQMSFYPLHRKRALFRVGAVVMWAGGIAMVLLGLPWYSVAILVAAVLAFDVYGLPGFSAPAFRRFDSLVGARRAAGG